MSMIDDVLHKDIHTLHHHGKTIYLIGTAHISQESAELAEKTIRDIKPDYVAVELCEGRYRSLQEPDRWKNTDIVEVIRSGQSSVLMAQLLLAAFQKKLGDQLNIRPGEEMLRAARTAQEVGSRVIFADRAIKITLKRTWHALGFRSMFTLLYSLLLGAFTDRKLSTEDVSAFKEQRNVEALLKEFGDTFPQIKEPLISERDRYLADSIRSAAGPVIVAVVGAGHVPGIKEWLDKPIDKASLDIIHPRSLERRLIGYAIPLSIIGIILYGFGVGGSKTGVSMASAWVWATCITAAIGSIAAFGHPLTILASTLVAPFTAINPFLRPGWVGAIVEAMLRRPRVVDFETVTDDISSLRGIWTNRVSRILLLLVLVNLSSLLGAIYGVKLITALL